MAGRESSLETQNLTRVFRVERREERGQRREIRALDRADLAAQRGRLFGVLGPSGAGKTTLIMILATPLSPLGRGRSRCGSASRPPVPPITSTPTAGHALPSAAGIRSACCILVRSWCAAGSSRSGAEAFAREM